MEQIYLVATFAINFVNISRILLEVDNLSNTSEAVIYCLAWSTTKFAYYFIIFTVAMEMVKSVTFSDDFLKKLYKVRALPDFLLLCVLMFLRYIIFRIIKQHQNQ